MYGMRSLLKLMLIQDEQDVIIHYYKIIYTIYYNLLFTIYKTIYYNTLLQDYYVTTRHFYLNKKILRSLNGETDVVFLLIKIYYYKTM